MASYITVSPQSFSPSAYGDNMNFVQSTLIPPISGYWANLQANLASVDPQNPASLLNVQFLMSEYENAVETASQLYAAFATLIQDIIQNIR